MKHTPDLNFFALLASQPSLAAASLELGVTPPAVSRRLAQLEQRLGVRLLNRTTRRLSLTPEGERYLEEGARILRDIEGLERSLSAGSDVPHGVLRINATFGFGRRHLSPAISEFRQLYPSVEIVLQLTDRNLDLTANAMDTDREACLQAGMNDHVGKPFHLAHLVQLLRRVTGRLD